MKRFLWFVLNSFLLINISAPAFSQLTPLGESFARASAEITATKVMSPLPEILSRQVVGSTITARYLARIPSRTNQPGVPIKIQSISLRFQNRKFAGLGTEILQLPQTPYSLSLMRNEMVGLALLKRLSHSEIEKAVHFYQERLQEAPKIFATAKKGETLENFSQRALKNGGEEAKVFGLFADATALSLLGEKQGTAALFDFYQSSRRTIFETPAKVLLERNALRQGAQPKPKIKENAFKKKILFGEPSSFEKGLFLQGPFAGLAGNFMAYGTDTWRALGGLDDFMWVDSAAQEQSSIGTKEDFTGLLALTPSFAEETLSREPQALLAEIWRLGEEGNLANKPHSGDFSWKKYLSSIDKAMKEGNWRDEDTKQLRNFLQVLRNLMKEPHAIGKLLIGGEPYIPGGKIDYMPSLEIESYLPEQAEAELKTAGISWDVLNRNKIFIIRTPQDYWNFEKIVEKAFPEGEWRIGAHETRVLRKESFATDPQNALLRSRDGNVHFHIHRVVEENGILKNYTFKMDLTNLQIGSKTLGEILDPEYLRFRIKGIRSTLGKFKAAPVDQFSPDEIEKALREAESFRQEWTDMRATLSNMIGKRGKDGKIEGLWQIEGLGEHIGVKGMRNLPELLNGYIRELDTLLHDGVDKVTRRRAERETLN